MADKDNKLVRGKSGIAKVISVIPLNQQQLTEITEIIREKFGENFEVENQIDKSLIAGLVVEVGDKVFDSSIATKIKKVKENLLA